ncbi:MAG: hypothetical protein HVN35_08680 [Methanobacteriaceae archaeon]|nr:hypothetical protein [Methanobacteriaceae archaeon]
MVGNALKTGLIMQKHFPPWNKNWKASPQPEDVEKAVYVMHMPRAFMGLDTYRGGDVGSRQLTISLKTKASFSIHSHIHKFPSR